LPIPKPIKKVLKSGWKSQGSNFFFWLEHFPVDVPLIKPSPEEQVRNHKLILNEVREYIKMMKNTIQSQEFTFLPLDGRIKRTNPTFQ